MEAASTDVKTLTDLSKMESRPKSLWAYAWENLLKDKIAMISLVIVGFYAVIALASASGLLASDWAREVGSSYLAPSSEFALGTDIFGRSVFLKVIKGAEVAMAVGLFAGIISTFIGLFLGALAGYFGGKVDELIVWVYNTFSSIPYIFLIIAISLAIGRGLSTVIIALGFTGWVTLCRLVRGEVLRHKQRDYVQSAAALGGGHVRKLFKHIFPNIFHIVIINFSLQFQVAIKSEVILSYLGLGVQGRPSWGTMIDDAKLELARGVWWQLAGATFAMLFVVMAFNFLGDALRDSLDPKLKGKS